MFSLNRLVRLGYVACLLLGAVALTSPPSSKAQTFRTHNMLIPPGAGANAAGVSGAGAGGRMMALMGGMMGVGGGMMGMGGQMMGMGGQMMGGMGGQMMGGGFGGKMMGMGGFNGGTGL